MTSWQRGQENEQEGQREERQGANRGDLGEQIRGGAKDLGGKVGDTLTQAGWKVGAVANADRQDLTQTIVYYSDPKNEAAALGVAQSLPGATVSLTQDFAGSGADLTVVVGSNYTG